MIVCFFRRFFFRLGILMPSSAPALASTSSISFEDWAGMRNSSSASRLVFDAALSIFTAVFFSFV